jgi:hypothetical protein
MKNRRQRDGEQKNLPRTAKTFCRGFTRINADLTKEQIKNFFTTEDAEGTQRNSSLGFVARALQPELCSVTLAHLLPAIKTILF